MRAYDAWKTYKNGQKVAEVQQDVVAVLKVEKEIAEDVFAGREMSDREYRRTRELLNLHDVKLGGLIHRVDAIERRLRISRLLEWPRVHQEVITRTCKSAILDPELAGNDEYGFRSLAQGQCLVALLLGEPQLLGEFGIEFGEFARLLDDCPLQLLVREPLELAGGAHPDPPRRTGATRLASLRP